MSKVIRMDFTFAGMDAAEEGGFVAYDDYAKLEAVVDASDMEICKLYDENVKLREAAQAYLKAEKLVDEYTNDGIDDYLLRTKLYRVRNDRLDALTAALEISDEEEKN